MVLKLSSLGGGSSANGFNIDIGTSGYSTTFLGQTYFSGGYSITSQLQDTSMDIYAIAEDGTLAGYTATKSLITSKDFDTIVIFGATNNDLLTFEYKSTSSPSSSGNEVAASPYITSISASNLVDIDDTTVVTGGNFATNVQAYFIGSDDVEREAKSVVRSNINELIVTRPDSLPTEYSPYSIKLVNSGINVASSTNPHILSDSISAGSSPTWNTTSMDIILYNILYSFSLSATDPDGSSISYSIVSGTLPTGISLDSSTGVISGTPSVTGETGTSNITFRATDAGGNYLDKQLSMTYVQDFITGGTLTESGGYKYRTYTSTESITVYADTTSDILIVAGGGGTGFNHEAAGGGAGGLLEATSYNLSAGSYTLTVGAGGTGSPNSSDQTQTNGSNSSIGSFIAYGGGRGGSETVARTGGGSGGGGSHSIAYSGGPASQPSYTGFTGYAYAGGSGTTGNNFMPGGGGGAGGAGSSSAVGGIGRPFFGTYYAGGGAGSNRTTTIYSGGLGGGGNSGQDGAANTGGGGGGSSFNVNIKGGQGGSGVIIIRYPI